MGHTNLPERDEVTDLGVLGGVEYCSAVAVLVAGAGLVGGDLLEGSRGCCL